MPCLTGNKAKFTWTAGSGGEAITATRGFRWSMVYEKPLTETSPFGVEFDEYSPGKARAAGVVAISLVNSENPAPPSGVAGTLSLWNDGADSSPAYTGSVYIERLETGAVSRGVVEQVAFYSFRFTGTITHNAAN